MPPGETVRLSGLVLFFANSKRSVSNFDLKATLAAGSPLPVQYSTSPP